MLKKVVRRLMHPVLGKPIQIFKNYLVHKPEAPPPTVHPSRRPKPDIFHAAGYGPPDAVRPSARQITLERRAKMEQEAKRARELRRAHAPRPIPGTFTYASLSEIDPDLTRAPRRRPATTNLPNRTATLRATGSFKRSKPLASHPARQQSQKQRSFGNLSRQNSSSNSKELTRQLSELSIDLEDLPEADEEVVQNPLNAIEHHCLEIAKDGKPLTKEQQFLLQEAQRLKVREEQTTVVLEKATYKAKVDKVRRKQADPVEPERPSKRVRSPEKPVEPATPKASPSKRSGRYGLRAEESSFTVYVRKGDGYEPDEEATRVLKELKEKEIRELKEEEFRRAAEERRREEERAKYNPFLTETRKPTGRRVATTGGYHTRARPRQPPLPTPKQLVTDESQHMEFLRVAKQAEENERRAQEEARRVEEFQKRVRLQQEEEEAQQQRLKHEREQEERQRLNEIFQRQAEEVRRVQREAEEKARSAFTRSNGFYDMNVDPPPTAQGLLLQNYETRWENLIMQKGARRLYFSDMPWPVLDDQPDLAALTPAKIEEFIAHSLRRVTKSQGGMKQLLKQDLLMWHPDRFAKYRSAIHKSHWPAIQQGVNIVAQVLINMKKNVARFE